MENKQNTLEIMSPQINEIAAALAKAQGQMKHAVFNKVNPHFKNKYADMSACIDVGRDILASNGLSFSQIPYTLDGKMYLRTLLMHISGQWLCGEFPLVSAKMDSQGYGSAMTYARRYSFCGMLGIAADEDDDGNSASGKSIAQEAPKPISNAPESRLNVSEITTLKNLKLQLDAESNKKISEWLTRVYQTNRFEELPGDCFTKVLGTYSQAVKKLEYARQQVG